MNVLLACIDPKLLTECERGNLAALAIPLELMVTQDLPVMQTVVPRVEIIMGGFPHELLTLASNLRWYQQFGTGVEWLEKYPEIAARDFILTNVSDNHFTPLAEHVMAFILAFTRQLPEAWRNQTKCVWKRPAVNDPGLWDLAGKNVTVLGLGSIGCEVARLADAFRMNVAGVRADATKRVAGVHTIVTPENWQRVLGAADIVVNTLPLSPQTRGLVNRTAFSQMKPGAYFVNVGRGGTVDESALIQALQSGHLGGAGLDVFVDEPLKRDSPLWLMKNVIITAHYAGASESINNRFLEVALDNMSRYRGGRPMRNIVDKGRFY